MSTLDWIKKNLLGSSTMPAGTGGASVQTGHVHKAGGGCCGHDHDHDHDHDHEHSHHNHAHGHDTACDKDHEHDEDCTTPKDGCC